MTLTSRQRQVLQFIADFAARNGYTPTRLEIAENFGWRSDNAAETHVQALQRHGALQLVRGTARGLRITPAGRNVLGATSPLPTGGPVMLRLPVIDTRRLRPGWGAR